VEDTGIGIPPDQLERVFRPFEQAEGAIRSTEGTGLGLAISRQLVQLMGGDLQVESELDQGSTFWFEITLPVTEMPAQARSAQPSERFIIGYQGPRRKVLVVDDIPSNRAMMVDLLAPLKFDIVEAVNGQQAIHLAQEAQPDLILMDRRMPVMDGLEAVRQIRQMPELAEVPIITMSASVSEEDQVLSRGIGVDAFLPKPISWSNLAALLEEYLKLEWEYEEKDEGGWQKDEEVVLTSPPKEEMEVLFDLAMRGDMRGIQKRMTHLEQMDERFRPFADKLRQLAKGFESKAILAMVKQYMEEDQ
jgi:CheY-like chemotaxis protein